MMIDEIKAVFMEECIKWLTKKSTDPVDEEFLVEELCKEMHYAFRTPGDELGKLYPPLDCDKILETIRRSALKYGFTFKRVAHRNEPHIRCEWLLKRSRKSINNESTIYIEVLFNNYIIVIGETWSDACFGYKTLESTIDSWAFGSMQ